MELSKKIADWVKKQVEESNKKGIVVGLSGGVDSAVVAVISKMALGDNVMGLILPCKSNPEDLRLAKEVAGKFNIKTKEVPLDKIYDEFAKLNTKAKGIAQANIKPRFRMVALYYFANTLDYLVAGTGNKSEISVGYFTKYGDGGVDILPLGGLLKTEVRKLAKELGIPDEIISRAPSAGLCKGQTDEGEMGISYDELDKTIKAIEDNKTESINKATLLKVKRMTEISEHKRRAIPVFNK